LRVPDLVAEGFTFLESPRWRDGRLFASDFYSGRVLSFREDGAVEEICRLQGQPSGLGVTSDGSLLIVSMLDRKLMRFDGVRLEVYADLGGLTGYPCNDMILTPEGTAIVGHFGYAPTPDSPIETGGLFTVDQTGTVRESVEGLFFPNGMSFAGDILLVAETFASRISAFDIGAEGRLSPRPPWATFSKRAPTTIGDALRMGEILPDGMTVDVEGAAWIADAGGRGALRVAAGGEILDRIETPGFTVYAIALGGSDGRTAFLCAAPPLFTHDPTRERKSVLMTCRVDIPGAGQP